MNAKYSMLMTLDGFRQVYDPVEQLPGGRFFQKCLEVTCRKFLQAINGKRPGHLTNHLVTLLNAATDRLGTYSAAERKASAELGSVGKDAVDRLRKFIDAYPLPDLTAPAKLSTYSEFKASAKDTCRVGMIPVNDENGVLVHLSDGRWMMPKEWVPGLDVNKASNPQKFEYFAKKVEPGKPLEEIALWRQYLGEDICCRVRFDGQWVMVKAVLFSHFYRQCQKHGAKISLGRLLSYRGSEGTPIVVAFKDEKFTGLLMPMVIPGQVDHTPHHRANIITVKQ